VLWLARVLVHWIVPIISLYSQERFAGQFHDSSTVSSLPDTKSGDVI
jgi:hypothetical protein